MPTIHNPTVTTFHLRPCGEAKVEGQAPKPLCRKALGPQSSVQLSEKELDALLEEPAWKERLEKAGDGYRVREHRGVAADFDRRIRAARREKARAEAEQARSSENVETLKRRLEALESQAAADKPKADQQVSSDDTSKSGGKGGGGKGKG